MEGPLYHVLLEGRKVGPYDRRTIVGMRIRKTLTSEHVLITTQGVQLTVADLLKHRPRDNAFQPNRSGSYSLVQATYSASLLHADGRGFAIPAFKGEVEARVQKDVLRIAGRFRQGLGWKEDRVKLPLVDVLHARIRGSTVDLWLRRAEGGLQRVTLELFTPDAAGEFVDFLPGASPWPHGEKQGGAAAVAGGTHPLLWGAVVGTVVVVGSVLVWVMSRGV